MGWGFLGITVFVAIGIVMAIILEATGIASP
jgi:hypothetical protein